MSADGWVNFIPETMRVCVCGELIHNRTGVWRRVGREGFVPHCRVTGADHRPAPPQPEPSDTELPTIQQMQGFIPDLIGGRKMRDYLRDYADAKPSDTGEQIA